MDIRQYIAAAERTYTYRIKSCVPLTDAEMDKIERVILKYDPINLGNPKKTIFQSNPLDFPNVQNVEVYIVDTELGLPVSPSVLMREITDALKVAQKFIVVRGENDPIELENQRLAAEAEMAEDGCPGSVLKNENYEEGDEKKGEEFYGTAYNSKLLGYLGKVQKEREDASKVDAPNPLFKWLDMPASDANQKGDEFNKDIKDAPRVEGTDANSEAEKSMHGNLDDTKKKFRRVFKDKSCNNKVATRDADSVARKGK